MRARDDKTKILAWEAPAFPGQSTTSGTTGTMHPLEHAHYMRMRAHFTRPGPSSSLGTPISLFDGAAETFFSIGFRCHFDIFLWLGNVYLFGRHQHLFIYTLVFRHSASDPPLNTNTNLQSHAIKTLKHYKLDLATFISC